MTYTTRLALAALAFAAAVPTGGAVAAQENPPGDPAAGQAVPGDAEGDAAGGEPDRPSWSVTPAGPDGLSERTNFIYTLPPGGRLVDAVAVTNVDPEPLTVAVYPADAYNTSADGAFALRLPEEPKEGIGAWIRLGVGEYTIPPETTVQIPFELTVPEDAEPGDHAGALLAASVELEEGGGSEEVEVRLRRRVGARIYVRVEGPLDPALTVSALDADGSQALVPLVTGAGEVEVDYTVANTGNVRVTPTAHLELVGPFGVTVRRTEAETLPELLPGGSVDRHARIDGLPPLGRLHVRVVITSDEADARSSRAIWAVPWAWLVALAIVALWVWRRRRARRAPPEAPAAEPEREEQLTA
ncbi:MAG TPA: hypothetical protein VFZ77_18805 [Acidimicrobiales bacterium]